MTTRTAPREREPECSACEAGWPRHVSIDGKWATHTYPPGYRGMRVEPNHCRSWPVPEEPREEREEEFVIRADRGFGPYWRENRQGYTGNVNDAGRYTRKEAEAIERLRGTDLKQPAPPITVPVPRDVLQEIASALEDGLSVILPSEFPQAEAALRASLSRLRGAMGKGK